MYEKVSPENSTFAPNNLFHPTIYLHPFLASPRLPMVHGKVEVG